MRTRELLVQGAYEFTPPTFEDERGVFVSPFQEWSLLAAVKGSFRLAQTNLSRSMLGVVRGVHFTHDPPGQEKYVYCARGRVLDVVVDLRVGSPTFGQWDSLELDDVTFRAIFCPRGVGHAFAALEDNTVMSYLMSMSYDPALELGIHPLDPELGLPWPWTDGAILSERDRCAPTLAAARRQGILPPYRDG